MGKIAVASILAPFKAAYGMVKSIVSTLSRALGLTADVTKSASNAASTVAGSTSTAASSTASAAKAGGGGFFGGVKSFFGGIGEKISTTAGNVVKGAKNLVGDPVGQLKKLLPTGKGMVKLLKRIPVVGTVIEGILASMDIARIVADGGDENTVYQQIGKRTLQGVGGVIGGAGAAAITTALSATGIPTFLLNALAYAGGDFLGRTLFGFIADKFGGASTSLGKGVASVFGIDVGEQVDSAAQTPDKINVEDFVIKPLNKDTITMAGGTKLGGNVEELLQELIGVVREGATVNFDSRAVGEALVLGAAKY